MVLNESTVGAFHLRQPFLIIVTQGVQNTFAQLNSIFRIVLELGLFDVNVLMKDECGNSQSFYFYQPFASDCHSIDIKRIETFTLQNYTNELNVQYKDLFPKHQFKFPNCTLRISTFSIEPFVIIRNATNGTYEYDGVDVSIVNEISKTLNLTPSYVQSTDGKQRGIIFANGTSTGSLKMVICTNFKPKLKQNQIIHVN